jgi:hypothetical protein
VNKDVTFCIGPQFKRISVFIKLKAVGFFHFHVKWNLIVALDVQ